MNGGAYILVVIGILAAKCLGFLRDIVFASVFGASEYTDIYFQVFSLASLIFTGIGAALSVCIIKNLNKPENLGEANQRRYVAHFMTKTSLYVLLATALLYALSGPIVRLLLPGLQADLYAVAVKTMYIMLPSCLFVILAYIMSGVLQNSKVFFITSVMSLPYNVLIIAALFMKNISLTTVSILTTVGWFLHIVILLPSFYKKGFRIFGKPMQDVRRENNREVIYIFISGMMFQLVFMIDKASVSADMGAASTVNYASNLFIAVASVFVVAMSNVSYPSICKHYEAKDTVQVRKILQYILIVLFAIFVPFILAVTCFGREIISLLYERGEFTKELSDVTAMLFSIYTLGVFGYVCQELLNKILYLAGKYIYTVIGTLAVVLLKPIANILVLSNGGSVIEVAVATTVLFTLYAICILFAIRKAVGNYADKVLILNFAKILLAGAVALGVYLLSSFLPLPLRESKIGFILPLGACAVSYAAVLLFTGSLKYIFKKQG